MIRVLVTGAGAPGIEGTLYALKHNPDNETIYTVTTDIQNNVAGKYLSDAFYTLPQPEDNGYLDQLKGVVSKEKIEVILPQTTREIAVLSANKGVIEGWGCKVVVSKKESIENANDKFLILEACREINVAYPMYQLVKTKAALIQAIYDLGYPEKKVIIKPRLSNGQRGVRLISPNEIDFETIQNQKPDQLQLSFSQLEQSLEQVDSINDYLVTEYLPGTEYTVDSFRNAEACQSFVRKRVKIRSGITFESQIENQPQIEAASNRLAEALDLEYCFGFQFKLDTDGVPKLLESNPRVQGTMVATVLAGMNMIYYAVCEALNRPYTLPDQVDVGARFIRTWSGMNIATNANTEHI